MNTKNGTVMSGYQFSTWKVGVEGHLERPLPPKPESCGRTDKANHAEDPLPGKEQHHHRAEHEERDEFRAHVIGFPRQMATSLKNVEMSWSSIMKIAKVMTDLTGHSGGAQAE
jgi:hypothetical protein